MLNEFIDKILVHEPVYGKRKCHRTQKIEIFFNFIGKVDLPSMNEPVDWDKVEQEKKQAKKERRRQYNRERREKLRAEHALTEVI